MIKLEYTTMSYTMSAEPNKNGDLEKLNGLAAEGWRVIKILPRHTDGTSFLIFLEREIYEQR